MELHSNGGALRSRALSVADFATVPDYTTEPSKVHFAFLSVSPPSTFFRPSALPQHSGARLQGLTLFGFMFAPSWRPFFLKREP